MQFLGLLRCNVATDHIGQVPSWKIKGSLCPVCTSFWHVQTVLVAVCITLNKDILVRISYSLHRLVEEIGPTTLQTSICTERLLTW